MLLEAKSVSCFSSQFVLKIDGRPLGTFQNRWFSETLGIDLSGRRHLQFRKVGWLGGSFELVDLAQDRLLGSCKPSGFFRSGWDLELSVGLGQLQRAGWFTSVCEFVHDNEVLAQVDRFGWCERGWFVDGAEILVMEDLLLVGLVYHVIEQRQASQQSHVGTHGG
jgi:hypothetical protein